MYYSTNTKAAPLPFGLFRVQLPGLIVCKIKGFDEEIRVEFVSVLFGSGKG